MIMQYSARPCSSHENQTRCKQWTARSCIKEHEHAGPYKFSREAQFRVHEQAPESA